MTNNLYKVEDTVRSIAKRCKSVKYSRGLAILFLMLGGVHFLKKQMMKALKTQSQQENK